MNISRQLVLSMLSLLFLGCSQIDLQTKLDQVFLPQGALQGVIDSDGLTRSFKAIPYSAAPVGNLRWQPPQPAKGWQGVRDASNFGNRCMQNPLYSDMQFRDTGTSEDCLFLNVWSPNEMTQDLPVLVYFYGGGFRAGDGSEKRYDGASMARKGIVTVTVNYRLGIFGLLAHPQLSEASGYNGSGNYTFMDQAAAIQWVKNNIQHFGGDPNKITIAGESAGSFSVSALMASPLSRDLINGAIGESGSLLAGRLATLAVAEKRGAELIGSIAVQQGIAAEDAISQLRKVPAKQLLNWVTQVKFGYFSANVDNYVLPKNIIDMYKQGEYAKVPFMAGNNSQEGSYKSLLHNLSPNVENYKKALNSRYPDSAEEMFALYPANSEEQVKDAAQAIASDEFISLSTWNWMDLVSQTNPQSTYFYHYDHVRPLMKAQYWTNKWPQTPARGATHSAEIEYALGNLDVNPLYHWQPVDYQVSDIIQQYFINFIKTGNPNGQDLTQWPEFKQNKQLVIQAKPYVEDIEFLHTRYRGLNSLKQLGIN